MGKIILASGTFDLLHYGHLKFLEKCKSIGGKDSKLIVIVARDSTVEKMKGRKPIMPEDQRRALVEALKPVDEAILGYEPPNYELVIDKIKPDIIAVGYDQEHVEEEVRKIIQRKKLNVEIVKIEFMSINELDSSSKLKEKIVEEWRKESLQRT